MKSLPLHTIERNPLLQARAALDAKTVSKYARLLRDGVDLSPIDVFEVEGRRLVANGWHRLYAHEQVGKAKITATVHQGTLQEAMEFAAFANSANGLQMDKRALKNAVKLALMAGSFQRHSEREMVAKLGVPKTTLNTWKRAAMKELGVAVETGEPAANLKPRQAQPLWDRSTGGFSTKGMAYLSYREAIEQLIRLLDRGEVDDAETRQAVMAEPEGWTPAGDRGLRRLGAMLLADAEAIEAAREAPLVVQMDQPEDDATFF